MLQYKIVPLRVCVNNLYNSDKLREKFRADKKDTTLSVITLDL